MNNHQIVIYEAKGVLKTALKVGMGIKLGLELGDFIYYLLARMLPVLYHL